MLIIPLITFDPIIMSIIPLITFTPIIKLIIPLIVFIMLNTVKDAITEFSSFPVTLFLFYSNNEMFYKILMHGKLKYFL